MPFKVIQIVFLKLFRLQVASVMFSSPKARTTLGYSECEKIMSTEDVFGKLISMIIFHRNRSESFHETSPRKWKKRRWKKCKIPTETSLTSFQWIFRAVVHGEKNFGGVWKFGHGLGAFRDVSCHFLSEGLLENLLENQSKMLITFRRDVITPRTSILLKIPSRPSNEHNISSDQVEFLLILHRLPIWSHKSAFNLVLICILIEWKKRWREMEIAPKTSPTRKWAAFAFRHPFRFDWVYRVIVFTSLTYH